MRAELPTAVAAAIEASTGVAIEASAEAAIGRGDQPKLIFDLARLEANLVGVAEAARGAGVTALFAAKSFPEAAVYRLAAARLAGFDVASPAEVEAAVAASDGGRAAVLSVVDPSGRAGAAAAEAGWRGRLMIGCETVEQVEAAPAEAEIAIRLSASLTGLDPAIGAVLDGSGHRRSRFGLDVEPEALRAGIAAMARAAGGRPIGLHVHHGAVAAGSADRFVATARAALTAAAAAGLSPRFLDLGGAWHAVADLPAALVAIRAAVPADVELIIEPGRRVADGAGFAASRVAVARMLDDRALCVLELSRVCHLRWSQPELVAPPPRTGAGQRVLFVGPTCYEDDVIGEWTVEPERFAAGRLAVFRNITGYAAAWNTGFGGIAPAEIILVD